MVVNNGLIVQPNHPRKTIMSGKKSAQLADLRSIHPLLLTQPLSDTLHVCSYLRVSKPRSATSQIFPGTLAKQTKQTKPGFERSLREVKNSSLVNFLKI